MNTFLPYANFERCAAVLDYRRLGKQRVEADQIWQILTGKTSSWSHHPAVKMWRGYEAALLMYRDTMIREWIRRGYRNTMPMRYVGGYEQPHWLGLERLHLSHQANLVRKNAILYGPIFGVSPQIGYYWPEGAVKPVLGVCRAVRSM